jgi:hypothetical protein
LQLALGLDDDALLPSEDAELDELLLSAWAAATTATAKAAAQKAVDFIAISQAKRPGGPEGRPVI